MPQLIRMTQELEQLICEATELTGAAPPEVLDDDAPVLADDAVREDIEESVYLVGIIGGKDVGKSSLVNALVGQQITPPTSHGPGTEYAIAYAHEAAAEQVRELLERELPGRFRIIPHANDALRRQVLLDLPDVDSHWADHLLVTRRMLRHILFPVWIQSVEKYADLAPQQLLAKVAAGNDPANFVFVLNKIDQLVAREGGGALGELSADFAQRIARTLGMSNAPRVHAISATHADAGDLPGLRQLLARQKSGDVVRHSQELAVRQKDRTLLSWLQRQGLAQRAEILGRLERDAQETIATRLGVPLLEHALPRLVDDPGHRLAMVEPALNKRLSRWPVVNIIDGALAPLFALVRRNLSAASATSAARALDTYLDQDARTVSSLVQSAFAQLHQTHPLVGQLYGHRKLWDELPADTAASDLRQRLSATIDHQRDAVMERVAGKSGAMTAPVRWLLTIGAILWFPFVQPLLEAFLAGGAGKTTRELLYLGVQMLGVTYLLKNVTFLIIWFVVLWMILRWGTHRRASRLLRRWQSNQNLDDPLSLSGQVIQWMDDLLEPIRRQRERVASLVIRTDAMRAALGEPRPVESSTAPPAAVGATGRA